MKVEYPTQEIVLHDEEIVTEYVDAARGPDVGSMFVMRSGTMQSDDLDRDDNNSNADKD